MSWQTIANRDGSDDDSARREDIRLPSWELTDPPKKQYLYTSIYIYIEDDFPCPKTGYVSSLETVVRQRRSGKLPAGSRPLAS